MGKKVEVKKLSSREIGGTGTYLFSGYISNEEYNNDLIGEKGLVIYDKMRKSDATVRASLLAVFLPLLEANWHFEAASDDPKDVEAKEFISEALFKRLPWIDFLREAMLYLVYGRMVFEKVFAMTEDNKIVWDKFGTRLPKTITKWEMDNGEAGVHQILPTGGAVDIPMRKLLIFTNEKEGDNWEGVSILRSSYQHWYLKQAIYKIEAMSIERQGLGIPVITTPAQTTPEDERKAKEIAKNMRANEKAYAQISEGWKIEILDMKGASTRQVQPAVMHHDRQIVKNVLAQFLELGTSGGAYNLGVSQQELLMLSLSFIAKYIASVLQPACNELLDYNFNLEEYPQLKASDIGKIDFNIVSQAAQRFAQSGVLTPTDSTEDYVRSMMDFPELKPEERAEIELNKFLDNIDKQNAPQPQMDPFGKPQFGGKPPFMKGAEDDKKVDKKDDDGKTEPKKDGDKGSIDPKKPAEQNPERNAKQQELKSFVLEKRQELEKMKISGTKVTPEYVSKVKIEIMEKQKEVGEETAEMDMYADEFYFSENREAIGDRLERIDDVLDKIES